MPLSDRQHDAFDKPANAQSQVGVFRVPREATYRPRDWLIRMGEVREV